jgi:hypothetical protein
LLSRPSLAIAIKAYRFVSIYTKQSLKNFLLLKRSLQPNRF